MNYEDLVAFLDEDFFETGEKPFFLKLAEFDLELLLDQLACLFRAVLEDFRDSEEFGFVVLNDTGVRGNAYFAIGEGVECLKCLIRVSSGGEKYMDLDILCGAVFDF